MTAKTVKKIKLDSKKGGAKTTVKAEEVKKAPKVKKERAKRRSLNPFSALWRYIKGSWYEIRQVRWPSRRATWGMTLAVIGFTAFFATLILLLDGLFQMLFKDFLLK